MNKTTVLFLLLFGFVLPVPVSAQLRMGVSAGYAFPTGDFGTINKNALGAALDGKFHINDRWAIRAQFAYYAFGRAGESLGQLSEAFGLSENTIQLLELFNADSLLQIPKVDFFPVTVGFEYSLLKNKWRPYVGWMVGINTTHTQDIDLDISQLLLAFFASTGQQPPANVTTLGNIALGASDANFGTGPILGLAYHLENRWSFDFQTQANALIVPDKKAAAVVLTFNLGLFYQINGRP